LIFWEIGVPEALSHWAKSAMSAMSIQLHRSKKKCKASKALWHCELIWRFPFRHGGTPVHNPLILLGFSITNHPAIKGYPHDPPWLWNPPIYPHINLLDGRRAHSRTFLHVVCIATFGLIVGLKARGLGAIVCSKDHQAKRQEMDRNGNDWKQPLNARNDETYQSNSLQCQWNWLCHWAMRTINARCSMAFVDICRYL
jgi:hypothetical protein